MCIPRYAVMLAVKSITSISKKRRRSKRMTDGSPLGESLRVYVAKREEVAAFFNATLRGQTASQFAFSIGWNPPAVCIDNLDSLAIAWLDERWQWLEQDEHRERCRARDAQAEADSNNRQWRTTDGE